MQQMNNSLFCYMVNPEQMKHSVNTIRHTILLKWIVQIIMCNVKVVNMPLYLEKSTIRFKFQLISMSCFLY